MARTLAMFTDTSLCIGCRACQVACKQWNELGLEEPEWTGTYQNHAHFTDKTFRLVRFIEAPGAKPNGDLAWLLMSDVCKHCAQAGCLDACPTGALIRTEFETVIVQADICNGCGYCVTACPFGVIDRDPYDGRAAKCTLCYDRLHDGLEPACAKACPTDSIQFGPYDELVSVAKARVATLHARGLTDAYLYGAGDEGDEQLAGGLGAFFLLTQPPERFGLPAQADSPIQENAPYATAAGLAAAFVAVGATIASFVLAHRNG